MHHQRRMPPDYRRAFFEALKEAWPHRQGTDNTRSGHRALLAEILLREGKTHAEIAEAFGVEPDTVRLWIRRREQRFELWEPVVYVFGSTPEQIQGLEPPESEPEDPAVRRSTISTLSETEAERLHEMDRVARKVGSSYSPFATIEFTPSDP